MPATAAGQCAHPSITRKLWTETHPPPRLLRCAAPRQWGQRERRQRHQAVPPSPGFTLNDSAGAAERSSAPGQVSAFSPRAMAAQGWSEWLSGLLSGLWPRLPPQPGSHEAFLEEMRVSALLDKEKRKPAGQRDEELVHKLRVERYTLGLANAQVGTAAAAAGLSRGLVPDRQPCALGIPCFIRRSISICTCHLPTSHAGLEAPVQVCRFRLGPHHPHLLRWGAVGDAAHRCVVPRTGRLL